MPLRGHSRPGEADLRLSQELWLAESHLPDSPRGSAPWLPCSERQSHVNDELCRVYAPLRHGCPRDHRGMGMASTNAALISSPRMHPLSCHVRKGGQRASRNTSCCVMPWPVEHLSRVLLQSAPVSSGCPLSRHGHFADFSPFFL